MPEDKNKHLSSDIDFKLFMDSMANVKPISSDKRNTISDKPKPKPIKKYFQTEKTPLDSSIEEINDKQSNDILFFSRDGVQHKTIKQLKRGTLGIEDKIDLHGLNKQEATQLLLEFLDHPADSRPRCILIVHGKGMGSLNNRPVLKNLTFNLLKQHTNVLAFTSAQQRDGGTGAVYVLLKRHV